MTLNKGFINLLILLVTQKLLRKEIQKVFFKKMYTNSIKIKVIQKPSSEAITKLMIRRAVLYTHGSI
uniref:Uncharacterized protein n=1 Tax=Acrobeloides nanus TaxID=290746 RepID=A0A914CV76_9BILA